MNTIDELKRIRSILSAVTGLEDDDQEYVEDARKSVDRIIDSLAAPVQQEPVAGLSETQAKAILDLALDLEKTGRLVAITEGQERTDFVARNRNIQCALVDALRNATTPQPPAQQQEYWEEQPDGSVIPVDPSEMHPAPVQQEPVKLPPGSCASEWGGRPTGPCLYTQEQVLEIISNISPKPARRKPLTPERLHGLIGDAAVLIGKEFEEDFFAAASKLIRMAEAAHEIKDHP